MAVTKIRTWLASRDAVERTYLAAGCGVFALSALQTAKGFWFLLPADPFVGLLFVSVILAALYYLIRGIYLVIRCAIRERTRLPSRLKCLGWLIFSLIAYPLLDPYFQGVRLRFWLQGGEAAYLRFAAEVRSKHPADLPPLASDATCDQYWERERLEKSRWAEFRASLDQSLLNHHPTSWKRIGVLRDHVQLSSGSGMIGSWGIEIHDQADIPPLNSQSETHENPYLPRQKPMSPRVWYWESE